MKKFLSLVLAALFVLSNCAYSALWSNYSARKKCQILDDPTVPLYSLSMAYLPESRFEGHGKSAMLEVDGDWNNVAYFHDVLGGDIDLDLHLRSTVYFDSADIELPDQTAKFSFDFGWAWRFSSGAAFQLRLEPGLYYDVEELDGSIIHMPVSLAVVKAFNPELSGILGLQLRPSFAREVMPLVGLDWEINNSLRCSARLPESQLLAKLSSYWTAHIGLEWVALSYTLREKGSHDRDTMSYEDFRLTVGATYKKSDSLHFFGEIGRSFSRSVTFEDDAPGIERDITVDDAIFLRFGISGPF